MFFPLIDALIILQSTMVWRNLCIQYTYSIPVFDIHNNFTLSLDCNWQQRNVLLRVQLSYFMRDCMRMPQHNSLFKLVTNWHDAYARPWTQLAVFMKLTGIVSMQIAVEAAWLLADNEISTRV